MNADGTVASDMLQMTITADAASAAQAVHAAASKMRSGVSGGAWELL